MPTQTRIINRRNVKERQVSRGDSGMEPRDADGTAHLSVKEIGNLFVGGSLRGLAGRDVRDVRYARDAAPLRVNPNGTYAYGQVYVQFVRLAQPSGLPIVFLNGGTFTGAMWESTPDGRPGWQSFFLWRGHDTYLTDGVGRGRASYAPFPEIAPCDPVFRPLEETMRLLRIATDGQACQFPAGHLDAFAKQCVPRFPGQDELEIEAYGALFERVGPCIVIAQSSGGYLAAQLISRRVGRIAALVTVEMTAVPDLEVSDLEALASVPQLVVWGDNIGMSSIWNDAKATVSAYAVAVNARGGAVSLLDLPALGHFGNTHQLMADMNSDVVVGLIADWLDRAVGRG